MGVVEYNEIKTDVRKFMRNRNLALIAVLLFLPIVGESATGKIIQLSEHVSLIPGPVNGVSIQKDSARLVVYGDPTGEIKDAEIVLLTQSHVSEPGAGPS